MDRQAVDVDELRRAGRELRLERFERQIALHLRRHCERDSGERSPEEAPRPPALRSALVAHRIPPSAIVHVPVIPATDARVFPVRLRSELLAGRRGYRT